MTTPATFGLIVGNRGFFPAKLLRIRPGGNPQRSGAGGIQAVALPPDATRLARSAPPRCSQVR